MGARGRAYSQSIRFGTRRTASPGRVGVISGRVPFKNGHPYVNQVFIGYAGGAALDGHDGWLTYCGPANGGLINLNSIEVDELMYPIIIDCAACVRIARVPANSRARRELSVFSIRLTMR